MEWNCMWNIICLNYALRWVEGKMKQVEGKVFVGFHDCLEHSLEISSWVNHLSCLCQYTWAMGSLAAGHDFAASIHFI